MQHLIQNTLKSLNENHIFLQGEKIRILNRRKNKVHSKRITHLKIMQFPWNRILDFNSFSTINNLEKKYHIFYIVTSAFIKARSKPSINKSPPGCPYIAF